MNRPVWTGRFSLAARELFDRAFEDVLRRKKGVRLIGVAATNIVESATEDLFEPVERTRLRELTTAIDQVRKKFGFDAVATAGNAAAQETGAE